MKDITKPANVINISPENDNTQGYERERVGSNLVAHDWSSLAFGAARACELAEVKRVKEKGCCIGNESEIECRERLRNVLQAIILSEDRSRHLPRLN